MNIAVIFDQALECAGAFQYSLSLSLLLNKYKNQKYNFIFFTNIKKNINILKQFNILAVYLYLSPIDKFFIYLRKNYFIYVLLKKCRILGINKFDRILQKRGIDLIYFLSPSRLALFSDQFSYIFTVWDLCHRDSVEFPEVRIERQFEIREEIYKNTLPKAIKVITDCDFTKKNLMRRYNVDEERIAVISMFPASHANISDEEYKKNFVDIKRKYSIRMEYVFYPASLTPIKNHIYLLEGLAVLKEKYHKKIDAVFCGPKGNNFEFIFKKAEDFGISDQIHYVGFVTNEEMPYFYKQALALVMPIYAMPTNLPPLEAFKLGCPVLYSDLPGSKNQVKDAALLLDLNNPESLAKNILQLSENPSLVKILLEKGRRIADAIKEDDAWAELKNIFDEYYLKLKCWK